MLGPFLFLEFIAPTSSVDGLLGDMRMLGAGIDAQVLHLAAAERAARDHALDRLLDDALGETALEQLARGALLDAARMAGVPVVDLVGELLAGEGDLVGIDDDDVVAVVDMRGEGRLVLAAEDGWRRWRRDGRRRDLRRRSAPTSSPRPQASAKRLSWFCFLFGPSASTIALGPEGVSCCLDWRMLALPPKIKRRPGGPLFRDLDIREHPLTSQVGVCRKKQVITIGWSLWYYFTAHHCSRDRTADTDAELSVRGPEGYHLQI